MSVFCLLILVVTKEDFTCWLLLIATVVHFVQLGSQEHIAQIPAHQKQDAWRHYRISSNNDGPSEQALPGAF